MKAIKKPHELNGLDAEDELFAAISQLKDIAEVKQFFVDLCTPAELQAMADRWRVVEPLMQQQSYRKINEITGVSMTTIGRVARCISFGKGGYQLIYQRLQRQADE